MAQIHLLEANVSYDTAKQAVGKNQIIQMNGYGDDRYVVYDVMEESGQFIYRLINLRTYELRQIEIIRPLSEKFGIGYYFDDVNPQFMDTFEVEVLRSKAENIAGEKRKELQRKLEDDERLYALGLQRLEAIVPDDVKAVIIAEQREDDSDSMTDYFSYHSIRTVILGFSTHTKDLFSEMRKYAANFEETANLAEENEKYENREKYTGGDGYYLGESKYHGWIVKKTKYYKDRASIIKSFALVAGDEANVCVKVQEVTDNVNHSAIIGNFIIVDYSEKALAVFGDTKPIKDQLMALGGRFNPKLTHEGNKKAGWIFGKTKETQLRHLLTIK